MVEVLNPFTSVEPVKATLSTSMCSAMAIPAVGPYPGITFTTPGGKPAYTEDTSQFSFLSCVLRELSTVTLTYTQSAMSAVFPEMANISEKTLTLTWTCETTASDLSILLQTVRSCVNTILGDPGLH